MIGDVAAKLILIQAQSFFGNSSLYPSRGDYHNILKEHVQRRD